MKCIMLSLTLVTVCCVNSMYSMEEQNKAENNLIKAQQLYNKRQEIIRKMETKLEYTSFAGQEEYNTVVATETSRADRIFDKSRKRIQRVLNDKNADEVMKKSALDLGKKIDEISWASK
jgi:hypothetical protein